MVKIRMTRVGAKNNPYYRVLAIDERDRRDGPPLAYLGTHNPLAKKEATKLDLEAIDQWLAKGAQMSETVASLVRKCRRAAAGAS